MIFVKTPFPKISPFVRNQGYLSFLLPPRGFYHPFLVIVIILPLMPVQGQSIRRVQYFFNQIFYAFMEFKVEVNSRSANHELTQVAYLKIPG